MESIGTLEIQKFGSVFSQKFTKESVFSRKFTRGPGFRKGPGSVFSQCLVWFLVVQYAGKRLLE